ncbi:ATP-binding protein [Streptomyces sp. NBC_01023]|uniref:ATP-binding protein n=1 Tax=unclassified Streptomyces TaxID=2593676 RepID=UPI0030DE1D23|nr:ATP-binding protein [Streptomyces sp. NBC_01023]
MNHTINLAQHPAPGRTFTVLLSPTRRGARLARLLTTAHLGHWGLPAESAAHIVGELSANAMTHGRVPGRDFQLSLMVHGRALLRIEVSDARGERLPPGPGTAVIPAGDAESGRGLLIVDSLADRWGVTPGPFPRKTIWAELDLVPHGGQ